MSKVLVIVAHPDLSRSRHNRALAEAADGLDNVTVHNLYAAYPDFRIDAEREHALLSEHDVIVFQHPVYWYNVPALVRQWQDDVLTYGWAFTYDGTPSRVAGKKAYVAATAGGGRDVYTPEGMNGQTVEEYLNNWFGTLRLCQFDVQPLFVLYGTAYNISDEDLDLAVKRYSGLLASHA